MNSFQTRCKIPISCQGILCVKFANFFIVSLVRSVNIARAQEIFHVKISRKWHGFYRLCHWDRKYIDGQLNVKDFEITNRPISKKNLNYKDRILSAPKVTWNHIKFANIKRCPTCPWFIIKLTFSTRTDRK